MLTMEQRTPPTFHERLALAMKLSGKTNQSALAREIGVEPQTIQYLATRGKGSAHAPLLAIATGVNVLWLTKGEGPMLSSDPDRVAEPNEGDYSLIPQLTGKGSCGTGYMNDHVEVRGSLAFKREWIASVGRKAEDLFVMYAQGDSMAYTIRDGAVVLIDHTIKEPLDGEVYAFLHDGEVYIKRFFKNFDGSWRLVCDNPDKAKYPDRSIPANEPLPFEIIGEVFWQGGVLSQRR